MFVCGDFSFDSNLAITCFQQSPLSSLFNHHRNWKLSSPNSHYLFPKWCPLQNFICISMMQLHRADISKHNCINTFLKKTEWVYHIFNFYTSYHNVLTSVQWNCHSAACGSTFIKCDWWGWSSYFMKKLVA